MANDHPAPVMDARGAVGGYCGQALPRVEDAALLTGSGRYGDDLPVRSDTLHAAILRSPHAHATLVAIDCADALALPGVAAIITRDQVQRLGASLVVGVKAALECLPIAIDRVCNVSQPIAVVLADDRYRAEDALERLKVEYAALPAGVDPPAAPAPEAAVVYYG